MATITVMKNYVIKKAQGTTDDNLKKIVKVLKNYNKLDAQTKKQVGVAVEKMYTQLKAKESKKATPKAGTTPKSTGKKKLSTQDLKSAIAKFKAKVGAKTWKQATSGTSIKEDAERPALPKGKRYSKIKGNPYWENRANRSDVKQPPKTYPRLAKGGEVDESELRFQKENKLLESVDKDYVIVMYNTKTKKNEILTSPDTFKTQRYRYTSLMNKGKLVGFQKIKIVQLQDLDFTYEYNGELFAKGGEVESEMTYKEMTAYEKSNHIHYNPMNSRWVVTKNGKSKEFWNQEQAEKYAGFEFNSDLDSRYGRSKYKGLFAKGGMTEHGLKIGDKIVLKGFGNEIIVEDTYGNLAKVDLDNGKRVKIKYDSKSKKYVEKK